MTALLATIVQWILGTVGKWAYSKLSDAWKDHVAEEQIQKHVDDNLAKRDVIVKEIEDLHNAGLLTPEKINELRQRKIEQETDLFNGLHR